MPSPMPSPPTPHNHWQSLVKGSVRLFHEYANWLVGISWKRFAVLALLLVIATAILEKLPPFRWVETETISAPRARVPRIPSTVHIPKVRIETPNSPASDAKGDDVTISIDKNGVRITPRATGADSAASAASPEASAASDGSVEIKLPPGATSEVVRQAVEEARRAVIEAIEESRHDAEEAARDAVEAERQADEAAAEGGRIRTREEHADLTSFAWLFIAASAILKSTYKGRIQAEVKAAAATETAESEQLKRQVVEARMAAMQAQVEPHFLFNTLASIDHLIETDPPRASQMQKNLIALLRASMPTMRENHPAAHNLGREMAVIRPYLEILKVRMEERLQTEILVPDGLLSADFPSMMIQSLVENAIKHGLEPKAEGGKLTVRAEIVHGKLSVTVADTGLGFGKAATSGTGVGLNNIRERLQLLHGNKASMTVSENTPSGTVVTLIVPYQVQTSPEGASA